MSHLDVMVLVMLIGSMVAFCIEVATGDLAMGQLGLLLLGLAAFQQGMSLRRELRESRRAKP